jgi:hypothetical protein
VLATGAMTLANESVFHGQPVNWRVPIASGFAAIGFTLVERAAPKAAVMMAWTGFLVVLITRVNPAVPSPAESALSWWNQAGKK